MKKDYKFQTVTNPRGSMVTGRNGTHKLAKIDWWVTRDGSLFIDGIGISGRRLNAGFFIDAESAEKFITALKETL